MERLEGKMDMPLRRMEELAGMQEKVMKLKTAVVVLNETVANLSKEVAELKDKSNARDQQARGHSLRLYGLGLGEEEDNSAKFRRALLKRVYDTIVKPVLAAAKANKQLEALPSLANTVTEVYCVRVGAPEQAIAGQPVEPQLPPPLIIKFATAHVRMAFLKNKKTSLPPPPLTATDRAASIKKYVAVEDLMAPTYKKLREMLDSDKVDKVWAADGRLQFTVPGDKIIRKVKSVYASIDDILRG